MFGKTFGLGLSTYGKAFGFIFKHGLWYYLFFPLLIWGLLFYLNYELIDWLLDIAVDFACQWIGCPEASPAGESTSIWEDIWNWTAGGLEWGIRHTIKLSMGVFIVWMSKYMTLIMLSPVLAFLSEKTEKILTGNDYPFDFKQILKDVWRGILIALRNMFIEFFFIFLAWLIGWAIPFPGSSIILGIPVWILGWYFIGFSMIDYVNERRRFRVIESTRWVRKHKGLAIANGWMFAILIWITDAANVGFLGLMFAPILAVVGATIAVHELEGLEGNPYAVKAEPTPFEPIPDEMPEQETDATSPPASPEQPTPPENAPPPMPPQNPLDS